MLLAGAGLFAIIIIFSLFRATDVPNELYCESDDDCVEEQDCHATSCINKEFRDEGEPVFCTTECAPDTLDCGQGSCKCISNKCGAVFND